MTSKFGVICRLITPACDSVSLLMSEIQFEYAFLSMAKKKTKRKSLIPSERIAKSIVLLRNQKVILDSDLAELYGVETKVLVQAVKRNANRFPEDFMLQLTKDEFDLLKSRIVTTNPGRGGRRTAPYAFTEQGVAMLSSVLRSDRAVSVNIEIMRAFVRLRQMLSTHSNFERKLHTLEKKYDAQFKVVFEAIRELMIPPEPKKKRSIGFAPWKEE